MHMKRWKSLEVDHPRRKVKLKRCDEGIAVFLWDIGWWRWETWLVIVWCVGRCANVRTIEQEEEREVVWSCC